MHNFRQLQIWQEAMSIVRDTYIALKSLPDAERFGLISQISRCSVSVPSNIAEGSSRSSDKEFSHFLSIALGSLFELETQLLICVAVNHLTALQIQQLLLDITQLQKKISAFKKTLS
ncbi:four helix bundle protein [Pedobacter sp. MC2016-14]|uniref:four helix bundle protein n=1 Tax=Pedobacter sp. MC2016-14 TaxID=2897327 RepID=UPI001E39882E|nr:four helix bundle protein [Pedobacter sp. MC2016-14]MCD0486730.1 four helix bundle protein [Pedobacter sp. MC2016-14]